MGCLCEKPLLQHSFDVWSAPPQPPAALPRAVLAIVNPYSGGKTGLQIFARVKEQLERGGVPEVRLMETARAGHAMEIARDTDLSGVDVVCTVGGDGTVHEAVNGLMRRRGGLPPGLRVGVIPAGTGNTFAYDLGILSADDAAQCIMGGCVRNIDLLRITPAAGASPEAPAAAGGLKEPLVAPEPQDTQWSLNMIGFGVPAAVLRRANQLRCCGGAQYNCAAYLELIANPTYPCRIIAHGRTPGLSDAERERLQAENDYCMVQAQLTVHMGSKVPLCPRAQLDDGLIDLVLIPHGGRVALATLMEDAKKNKHMRAPLQYVRCEGFTLQPAQRVQGPATVNVDGELNQSSPCTVTCVPGALPICCPPPPGAQPPPQSQPQQPPPQPAQRAPSNPPPSNPPSRPPPAAAEQAAPSGLAGHYKALQAAGGDGGALPPHPPQPCWGQPPPRQQAHPHPQGADAAGALPPQAAVSPPRPAGGRGGGAAGPRVQTPPARVEEGGLLLAGPPPSGPPQCGQVYASGHTAQLLQ